LIVLATGSIAENDLEVELRGLNVEYYRIGDCLRIGKLEDAILSAWKTAFMF
jgi:hypothetical protein